MLSPQVVLIDTHVSSAKDLTYAKAPLLSTEFWRVTERWDKSLVPVYRTGLREGKFVFAIAKVVS